MSGRTPWREIKRRRGTFIALEGIEGGGKTTQVKLLGERLREEGHDVLVTREPGASLKERIRAILLDPELTMHPRTEMLLFEADRAEHVYGIIRPALAKGVVVISDRYEAGTYAYQHVAREACSEEEFRLINDFATGGLRPDITVWIDLPVDVGAARNRRVGKSDRFEQEAMDFHRTVRKGFEQYFESYAGGLARIDGTQDIAAVHAAVYAAVAPFLTAHP